MKQIENLCPETLHFFSNFRSFVNNWRRSCCCGFWENPITQFLNTDVEFEKNNLIFKVKKKTLLVKWLKLDYSRKRRHFFSIFQSWLKTSGYIFACFNNTKLLCKLWKMYFRISIRIVSDLNPKILSKIDTNRLQAKVFSKVIS